MELEQTWACRWESHLHPRQVMWVTTFMDLIRRTKELDWFHALHELSIKKSRSELCLRVLLHIVIPYNLS